MKMVALGDLMANRVPSLNPSKYPNEVFELWSIPAFDNGKPEITEGSNIGSSKKCVEPNDVLLSRIVPHIRRTWVVSESEGDLRQLASGEWIVFRSNQFHPDYLRHALTSDTFHARFMQTVAGVGGSLLRARPEGVKRIEIPLPPIAEQRRIAAILDKADGVRRKRKEAIALTEELLRSVFLDMFGDPVTNPKGWEVQPLGEIAHFVGGGTPSRKISEYFEGDICWATSKDMGVDVLSDTQEHITEEAIDNSATKLVQAGCLLVVVKSKVLMHRLPVARTIVPTCFGQDLKAIIPVDLSMTRYLHRHLKFGQEILLRQARGVNTEGLTLDHLRSFPVMMPAMQDMKQFVNLDIQLEISSKNQLCSAQDSNNLFNSLLQRAFRGKL